MFAILKNENHRDFLLEVIAAATYPGHALELAAEVKRHVEGAHFYEPIHEGSPSVSPPQDPNHTGNPPVVPYSELPPHQQMLVDRDYSPEV
jgi:hypothetical protein